MFDCTGKSTNSRTLSERDPEAGGLAGVVRFSAPQRGPGRSSGKQPILEHQFTWNCIKNVHIF